MSSFDYIEETDERDLYRYVSGVKLTPDERTAKPYVRTHIIGQNYLSGTVGYKGLSTRLVSNAFKYEGVNTIKNRHSRRVRGKVDGMKHFTESIVEFKGLKRQLWSLLDQGLRTITRRRGGFHLRDILNRGTAAQVPSIYLLYQFALAPLISQIEDTLKKLSAIEVEVYDRVYTTGVIPRRMLYSQSKGVKPVFLMENCSVSFCTTFTYTIDNNIKSVVAEFLGLNRPLTVFWDLKGWSWAYDYFFNLGELLANLDGEPLTRKVVYESHSHKFHADLSVGLGVLNAGDSAEKYHDRNLERGYTYIGEYGSDRSNTTNQRVYITGFPMRTGEVLHFERMLAYPELEFVPEWKFKPTFGSFQFANLASAIALSLKSYEVDPQLLQPFKKGHGESIKFNPRRL